MKTMQFDLYGEYSVQRPSGTTDGRLNAYLHESGNHPTMLVIPGGGYTFLSLPRSAPAIQSYFDLGYNCLELLYSIAPSAYPVQLAEAVMALDFAYSRADMLGLNKDKVIVTGFSAGGHLAAALTTIGCDERVEAYLGQKLTHRPDAMVLIYPVINLTDSITHEESATNVTGGNAELRGYLSVERHVTPDTPPTFIAHATTDAIVPFANSERFAEALENQGVRYDFKVFPKGRHGMVLEKDDEDGKCWSKWFDMSVEFLSKLGL